MVLAVFDLDGTLIDSLSQIAKNMNITRRAHGFPSMEIDFYRENLGRPVTEMFSDLKVNLEQKENLISYFRKLLVLDIRRNNLLFEGVMEAIEFLISKNFLLAIATSKPTYLAELVIQNSELKSFPFFIQGTDGFLPKPEPEVILRCLDHFGDQNAFMVGDRSEDMVAAKRAGVGSIGIASGFHSQNFLASHGADVTFESFYHFSLALADDTQLISKLTG